MLASGKCLRVGVCVCECLVAAQSHREIKQSVNYLERAPVAVTERRRLNIWDQILSSPCHIISSLAKLRQHTQNGQAQVRG